MLDLCHGCQLILSQDNPSELLRIGHQTTNNDVNRAIVKIHDPNPNESYYEVWLLEKTTDVVASELIDEQGNLYESTFIFCVDDYDDALNWFNNPDTSDPDTSDDDEEPQT